MHTHFGGEIVQCAAHGPPSIEGVDRPPEVRDLQLALGEEDRFVSMIYDHYWVINYEEKEPFLKKKKK